MIVWITLTAALIVIGVVLYYIYGPGYEKHLREDDPPINKQHPEATQEALALVRAYAKATGALADYERIITTPTGDFSIRIGEHHLFAFSCARKELLVRTLVDAQLGNFDLGPFQGHTVLHGAIPEFYTDGGSQMLVIKNSVADFSVKRTEFVKQLESYVRNAKEFDDVVLSHLGTTGQSR